MIPLSCSNCSYNALQYDNLGLTTGYCTQHRVALLRSDETTCRRQLRKDLGHDSRERAQALHRQAFPLNVVQTLRSKAPVNGAYTAAGKKVAFLESDSVAESVTNWGILDSKIATLAQLREIPGIRAELAMLSLGRGYVRNCVRKDRRWTSGIHVFWWTRQRIGDRPTVTATDIRRWSMDDPDREMELAAWSLVMLRLTLLADVAHYATGSGDPIADLADIVDAAAEATETPDLDALLQWIAEEGQARISRAFPYEKYEWWREALRSTEEDEAD